MALGIVNSKYFSNQNVDIMNEVLNSLVQPLCGSLLREDSQISLQLV